MLYDEKVLMMKMLNDEKVLIAYPAKEDVRFGIPTYACVFRSQENEYHLTQFLAG